ncbi:hypothetical protein ACO34A_00405 [Rhizobium sp. ACO-34A]|nr:hypothetical protein ACO34A_00405 [Rhizobium sp. ACO-34A]
MRGTVSLALQLFVAAALALTLAWWLDLANPYWAAMPVWVVQQAFREDLVQRAALRVAGTLAGAALSLAVVWLQFPDVAAALVLAVGVGASVACAYWIGTVMSYGAFMAGVTLLVVLLPEFTGFGIATGIEPMAVAVDRILCTLIGVACVTTITFAFTPRRTTQAPPRVREGRARRTLLRMVYCSSMARQRGGGRHCVSGFRDTRRSHDTGRLFDDPVVRAGSEADPAVICAGSGSRRLCVRSLSRPAVGCRRIGLNGVADCRIPSWRQLSSRIATHCFLRARRQYVLPHRFRSRRVAARRGRGGDGRCCGDLRVGRRLCFCTSAACGKTLAVAAACQMRGSSSRTMETAPFFSGRNSSRRPSGNCSQ